ncbi:MAG: type II secretion system F family protein, partial [Verrucomicrobiota bacterium]
MKLSLSDKVTLYHELGKMVRSGFGFPKAVAMLEDQAQRPTQRRFLQEVNLRLEKGATIHQAIDQPALGVTSLESSIVGASERGGVLEQGFEHLHKTFSSLRSTRRSIIAKLLYPALLFHLALFLPILPQLITGGDMGPVWAATFTSLFLVYGLVGGGVFLWRIADRTAAHHEGVDQILRSIPLLGGLRKLTALEHFTETFRIHLLAGLRMSEGLEAGGIASQSAVLSTDAKRLSQGAEAGKQLVETLPETRSLPNDFRQSLINAEHVGDLEKDLQRWSGYFAETRSNHLVRLGIILPGAAYLLAAIYV